MAAQRHRPAYDPDKVERILASIAAGFSVNCSCLCEGIRKPTFLLWVKEDVDGLSDRYLRAMGAGVRMRQARLEEIDSNDQRVRAEIERWWLERMDPDLCPPRQRVQHSGSVAVTLAELLHSDDSISEGDQEAIE